jgi:hypothetical protein
MMTSIKVRLTEKAVAKAFSSICFLISSSFFLRIALKDQLAAHIEDRIDEIL